MDPVPAKPGATAPAAMLEDAAGWSAEQGAADAKAAPPPPPPPPAVGVDAKTTADLLVTIVDLIVTSLVSPNLKLNDAELAALKEKAAPVVAIYFPPELMLGPVGALALTAAAIYGPKLMAPPPPAAQTVDSTATATPAAPVAA